MGERANAKFSLGPFDGAKFKALTEGLEVSVVRLSELNDGNPALRLDSEFFQKASLQALADVRRRMPVLLAELASRIQHPLEVAREYADEGLATLMAGNVRPNRAETEALPKMAVSADLVARNRLTTNDLVLVRTGANFGTVAPWKRETTVYACADLLVVRSPAAPNGYVSSFLAGKYGRPLLTRCAYGSAQPHISPLYVGLIPVPRLGDVETAVDTLVNKAVIAEQEASALLAKAEATLLGALGLADWSPPEPLTYTSSAAAVAAAGRLDAQYYMPAKIDMLAALAALPGGTIADSFESVRDMVDPTRGDRTRLVRNYDLTDALQPVLDASLAPVALAEIDSPKKRFADGDLAVSRLRSYLREIAVVRVTDAVPAIGSSEFFVLRRRPEARPISAEAMMIYLRAGPVQTVLKWCQDGSQHPRFAERDLMAIPLPDVVVETNDAMTKQVREALTQRARSLTLLAAARRAVEIAIEDGEDAALAHARQAAA